MPGSIALEVVIILLMIAANGLFAMAEIAIVSARKPRLQQAASKGDAGAEAALALANAPNRFLSTVQIGITLIGILAGAFGGATVAQELDALLGGLPVVGPYSEAIGVAVVVLATTYLSLVIGELVPKRLALANPEWVAARMARLMQRLSRIASPLVTLLTVSTDAIVRLLGAQNMRGASISEEEITLLIEQGIHEGVFEQAEHDMVERVLRLDARRVSSVMTPRTDIVWIDSSDPIEEIRRKVLASAHTHFPVGDGSLDQVRGVVSVKNLWACAEQGQPLKLSEALQAPLFIPENASVLNLLRLFQQQGQQIALIVDERGGIEGLVTLTDLLEAIVGDIPEVGEPSQPGPIVQRADGSWLVDGMLPVEDFKEELGIGSLPGEDQSAFQTVGGFVMAYLGRIPVTVDSFEWEGLSFEVVDMDGYRVDKVIVRRSSPERPESAR